MYIIGVEDTVNPRFSDCLIIEVKLNTKNLDLSSQTDRLIYNYLSKNNEKVGGVFNYIFYGQNNRVVLACIIYLRELMQLEQANKTNKEFIVSELIRTLETLDIHWH